MDYVDLLILFSLTMSVISWIAQFWCLYRLRLKYKGKRDPIRAWRIVKGSGDLTPYWMVGWGAFLVSFFCGICAYVSTPATAAYAGAFAVIYGISMLVQLQFFIAIIISLVDWFT